MAAQMNSGEDAALAMEAWRRALAALVMGGAPVGAAGLGQAQASFQHFADEFVRSAARAPATPGTEEAGERREAWAATAARLLGGMHAEPAPGSPPALAAALSAWATVQAALAADIAARFIERLGIERPATLRAGFDLFIDCAEAAFKVAAHGDAFITAQGALLNELVALRARQQQLLDKTARLAGMPSRAEVDALHDALAAVRAEMIALKDPPVKPSARRNRAASAVKRRRPKGVRK